LAYSRLTYSRWLTHISGHPSARPTSRAQDSESTSAKDQCSTAGPRNQRSNHDSVFISAASFLLELTSGHSTRRKTFVTFRTNSGPLKTARQRLLYWIAVTCPLNTVLDCGHSALMANCCMIPQTHRTQRSAVRITLPAFAAAEYIH